MSDLLLIDASEWKTNLMIGALIGFGFIFLSTIVSGFVIGVPNIPYSTFDDKVVVTAIAPIAEEFFFKTVIFGLLLLFFGTFVSTIATSIIFASFHYIAYGGSLLAASGLFVAAFTFSIVTLIIAEQRHDILSTITGHAIFNSYIAAKTLAIVSLLK